ncbi:MAG: 7-cyano-7-deazaguanine synthase QueC [Nitrospirae bacterium]|nr:7-cyano-7-deazaguanine synthase QueC [Nitrospirota bacterium]
MKRKSVLLLSGGIDSSTVLAIAKSEGYEVYAVSFDYNQRHRVELESAKDVASVLGVKKHLIIRFDLREIGGSALTSEMEVPKLRIAECGMRNKKYDNSEILIPKSAIPVTYVPARNTIFLSFALAWAEILKAENIFIGANAVDYSGYPDCRPEYLKAFEDMANLATKISVEGQIRFKIHAPLINMTKAEIIMKGMNLGLDYSLTWSCYDPQESRNALHVKRNKKKTDHGSRVTRHGFVPCGKCDSCLFRAKGFKEAGIKDSLVIIH